jgi:hypothetical protein
MVRGGRMKAKDLTKQACKNAVERYGEKQRKTKEYWDKKMEEIKEKK